MYHRFGVIIVRYNDNFTYDVTQAIVLTSPDSVTRPGSIDFVAVWALLEGVFGLSNPWKHLRMRHKSFY